MRLREHFTRRHVCLYEETRDCYHDDDWLLERRCKECGKFQHTTFVDSDPATQLPRNLWVIADLRWYDGKLECEVCDG